ncbi:MAG TPA: hypothetical protein VEL74_15680 [Thermoanaerobaculia bacterium]|nr:hypothetical protein [Thermoanaerobaculia bacterium]
MPAESFGESVSAMEQLVANAEPRVAGQPLLEGVLTELKDMLVEVRDLKKHQRETRATAQAATKQMLASLTRAQDLAARLRTGLTTLFGKYDERLVEFGIRPIRRRPQKGPIVSPVEDADPAETTGTTTS